MKGGIKYTGDTRKRIEDLFRENPDRTEKQFAQLSGATKAYAGQVVTVLRLKAIARETEGERDYVPNIAQAIEKQIGLYLSRAFEWKGAMEGATFVRFLNWSNIVSLCEKRGIKGLRDRMDELTEMCGIALQNANPTALIREFHSLDERLARIEALLGRFERERPPAPVVDIAPLQGPVRLVAGRSGV